VALSKKILDPGRLSRVRALRLGGQTASNIVCGMRLTLRVRAQLGLVKAQLEEDSCS